MRLRPPISTLTDTLFPYTTLFLSPLETASFNRRGDAVHHQVKGKIGDRVTDRREFPIEDGGDLGAVRAEDEVVTAKVAMNDRNFIVVRDMSEEPFAQSVNALIMTRARIGLRSEEHTSALQTLIRIPY